ncbi:ras-related protein Rab-17 isoform X4 [Sus scrofa]|uniref:Ras-related protein Rab-17 n=2 Tax=Sus scrofa TaxID=9823 RepID=A0A287B1S1_PIG|nr:ras-related protein Rab-17 isoform X4 [Sus scrofa]
MNWHQTLSLVPTLSLCRAWRRQMGPPAPAPPRASPASSSWFSWAVALWASPAWLSGAFFTKVVDLGAASLKLEIWDTAGQEKYHSVCHLYFRGANAALVVYDVTRKDSFLKAQQWLKDLEEEFRLGDVVVMLVGNKLDLGKEREVAFEEGKEFAESKGLLFMETSAKLNHQVTEAFGAIAQELWCREERKEDQQQQQRDAQLDLNQRPSAQARCCAR